MLSQPLFAKELKIAFGLLMPPYVISQDNKGIEIEIVKKVFSLNTINITPVYVPLARLPKEFKLNTIDGTLPVLESLGLKDAYYSNAYISYQNIAISLQKNNIQINSIKDLKNKDIVSFQNSKKYLGKVFLEAVKNNKNFYELYDQEKQVKMLFRNRTKVIVIDKNIFNYYKKQLTNTNTDVGITIHDIFPKTPYKIAFRNEQIRDDFNKGLELLKKQGLYDKIIKKYVK
jgi:polar amino acid transport system substrate-binding protein